MSYDWENELPKTCETCRVKLPSVKIPEGVTEEEYKKFRGIGNPNIIHVGSCRDCGGKATVRLLEDLESNDGKLPMNVVAHDSFERSKAITRKEKGITLDEPKTA